MKKVVITVVAVVFAAVAAQAQSARVEVGIMNDSWKGSLALNKRVEQEVTREEARQAQKQAKQEQAKQKNNSAVKRSPKAPATQKKVTNKNTQKPAKKAEKKENGTTTQWLEAIFLGGKFPGETDAEYHNRMMSQTQPATMPFK